MLTRGLASPPIARVADQNVLFITIDALRADAVGCYGGPAATPALDSLASSGQRPTLALCGRNRPPAAFRRLPRGS